MLAFTSFQETEVSSDNTDVISFHLITLWLMMSLVQHFMASHECCEDGEETTAVSTPQRARFFKCRRRCTKRQAKTEANGWRCPFECAFVRMHMPPPLPFHRRRGRRRRETCAREGTQEPSSSMTVSALPPSSPARVDRLSAHEPLERPPRSPRPSVVHQTSLLDLSRMQRWSDLLAQVSRRGAKQRDSDGLYPLHWACSGAPPLEAVRALLDAYPGAARKKDREGSTALHFATHYGAPESVVETLLESNQSALRSQDKYGRTPLYHAADKSASIDVLRTLAHADPDTITVPCIPPHKTKHSVTQKKNPYYRTPLYLVWASVLSNRQTRERRSGKLWDKAQLLLETAFLRFHAVHNPNAEVHYGAVHAAITLDNYLPPQSTELIIQCYPEQLEQPDGIRGQLPLALAASSTSLSSTRASELIRILLEMSPKAALSVDNDGRSPLVLAIESGHHWDTGIQRIFSAAPQVLGWLDGKFCLPPAFLAATIAPSKEDKPEASSERHNADPYGLLRAKESEAIQTISTTRARVVPGNPGDATSNPEARRLTTIYQLLQADPSICA